MTAKNYDQSDYDIYMAAIQYKIFNLKIFSLIYTAQAIGFTCMFCRLYRQHWDVLQNNLKTILMLFQLFMILAWLNTVAMSWGMRDKSLRTRYVAYVETFVYDNLNSSIFTILFYKVLYTFKQVEVQMNPKYECAESVLESLKKYKKMEIVQLTINAIMAVLIILMWIGVNYGSHEQKVLLILNTFMVHTLFFLNVYMNCYFHRMAMFYIDALGKKFKINTFKSKFVINSVTCIMLLAQFRNLCIHF